LGPTRKETLVSAPRRGGELRWQCPYRIHHGLAGTSSITSTRKRKTYIQILSFKLCDYPISTSWI
jgi:hypothetical protein